jgi:exodeoxyribonuclease VII large subunit
VLSYRLSRVDLVGKRAPRREALNERLAQALPRLLERKRARMAMAGRALHASDPSALLARGYAIVEYAGRVVRDASAVPLGERIEAKLAHGTLRARVEDRRDV